MDRDQRQKRQTTRPRTPEVITALGNGIKTNGTHTVHIGTNKIQVVAFSGRVATVETVVKPKADKSGLLYCLRVILCAHCGVKKKVLFVCIHNSARSQMAEALLKKSAVNSSKWNPRE